jgi:hypothetical protein
VRHVGYLQELNRDARSTEHKIRIAPFIPVITPVVYLHKLFSMEPQPISGLGRLITEIPRSHTTGHTHIPGRTPLNVWSTKRRGRYLHNTPQTQEMKSHALCGIRTCDPSNRTDIQLCLRPQGRRDRP